MIIIVSHGNNNNSSSYDANHDTTNHSSRFATCRGGFRGGLF